MAFLSVLTQCQNSETSRTNSFPPMLRTLNWQIQDEDLSFLLAFLIRLVFEQRRISFTFYMCKCSQHLIPNYLSRELIESVYDFQIGGWGAVQLLGCFPAS